MKASEVIKNLQELIEKHGDLECYVNTPYEGTDSVLSEFEHKEKDDNYGNMFGHKYKIEERFTSVL